MSELRTSVQSQKWQVFVGPELSVDSRAGVPVFTDFKPVNLTPNPERMRIARIRVNNLVHDMKVTWTPSLDADAKS